MNEACRTTSTLYTFPTYFQTPPFRPKNPGGYPPIPPGFPLPKRASGTPSWENDLLFIKRALSPSALHRIPGFARVRCARIGQDKTGSLLWSRRHILPGGFHSLCKKQLFLWSSHPVRLFSFSLKEEAVSSGEVADLEK